MAKADKPVTFAMALSDLLKLRHGCAWDGCEADYPGESDLPADWRWLFVWHGPPGAPPWAEGNIEDRDAVLCPRHHKLLDSYLKRIR